MRVLRWILTAVPLFLCGCSLAVLTLEPGEAATLRLNTRSTGAQMIEVDATSVGEGGAKVVFSREDLQLPPIYFESSPSGDSDDHQVNGRHGQFAARVWVPGWPVTKDSSFRVSNYGPGSVSLRRIRMRSGSSGEIYSRARLQAPDPPLAWSGLRAIQRDPLAEEADIPAVGYEIPGVHEWIAERRRRKLFEAIDGPAPAVRIRDGLRGDVEMRTSLMGANGAIVAFSRPARSEWKSIGPEWRPEPDESKWVPLPKDRTIPRGFFIEGSLKRVAFFVRAAEEADGSRVASNLPSGEALPPRAAVEARLFRLDTAPPVALQRWFNIGPEGGWIELEADRALPPGEYIAELKAITGAPQWLAADRDPIPVPGSDFPLPAETLAVEVTDEQVDYGLPISVQAFVRGRADAAEGLRDDWLEPQTVAARANAAEIALRAELRPGQTEVFYLRNFRSAYSEDAFARSATVPEWRKQWNRFREWSWRRLGI